MYSCIFLAILTLSPCVLGGSINRADLLAHTAADAAGKPAVLERAAAAVPLQPVTTAAQGTGNVEYKPIDTEYYTPNEVYESGDKQDCHPVEKLVYKDECIPYKEKTCFTQQQETCKDVFEKNCTAVIDTFDVRECFNVTELICKLAETIEYEMAEEDYTVQRCTSTSERVCDTVSDLAVTTKDDFQCVDIKYNYCWDEKRTIKDRTCTFSVDFDCGKFMPKDGKGSVTCSKVPTKKCYDTPRKVTEEKCKPRTNRWCEKLTNEMPIPVQKQNCHREPKKTCELENRSRPKKCKKYVYTKECSPVPRQICDNKSVTKLRPVCDKIQRNVCSYEPQEKCQEEEKKYCYKVESKVWEKVCEADKVDIIDTTFNFI